MKMPAESRSESQRRNIAAIIGKIPFFSCLGEEEIREVETMIHSRRVAKNEIVLFEEDTPNFMYVVFSGRVRVVHMNEEGKERILAIHKRGEFFGEMALLDGKTAPASVIAMEESEIGLLARQDFEHYLVRNNGVLLQLVKLLCARFREALLMLKTMSFADSEQRLREVLKSMSRLYGVRDNRGVMIGLKLTHQEIADYASVSRETVTRILGKLSRDGEIEILDNKNILVKSTFFGKLGFL